MIPVVRRTLERMLLPAAPAARRRLARHGGAAILSYHNVAPDGAPQRGDTSLHLPLRAFLDQMDRLRRTHRVVALPDLVEGRLPRTAEPLAAITFDDAYRGALTLAIPALVERGLPATVFVAPGLLGQRSFWWDALATPGGRGLPPSVRSEVLGSRGGRWSSPWPDSDLRPDQGPGDLEALARAAELPGISLAPHSWSHPNLTALDPAELAAELSRPREWLRATFPLRSCADHLAFPYGLWNGAVAAAARAAGYRFLYRVEGGVARSIVGEAGAIPRINVPAGISGARLELRTSGLALT